VTAKINMSHTLSLTHTRVQTHTCTHTYTATSGGAKMANHNEMDAETNRYRQRNAERITEIEKERVGENGRS